MLTVEQALQLVIENTRPLPRVEVPLLEALGRVLAEDVASDIDSPPYDKSVVDGYAVQTADFVDGRAELVFLEEITAGMVPTQRVESGTTTRIMTGAPIPAGADGVVMVERSTIVETGGVIRIQLVEPKIKSGQNIIRQGSSMRRGETILSKKSPQPITPVAIGVLAEIGRTKVRVVPQPSVAILATGNELVPPGTTPGPGQIRNSNESMLAALTIQAGGTPRLLGVARDERDELRQKISAGLDADILLLSGGVSAGVLDLVPGVLRELGVVEVFHKVSLKPGKPLWFGVLDHGERRTLVFGLPGNPVSTFVCFRLFVDAALQYLIRGYETASLPAHALQPQLPARLGTDFNHRGDRPTYHPARYQEANNSNGEWGQDIVTPLAWKGSGDLRTLLDADALIVFPPGDKQYAKGDAISYLPL
ncbi:MAG: molybdopterin molybdotransferase MoeA [Planctomycetaceae bacterium]|nr:molybdopterin molybdotransferase MoeA [Planctomycetaceae bacterium]